MKLRLLSFMILLLSAMTAAADDTTISVSVNGGETKTGTTGTLQTLIGDKYMSVTSLIVSGTLNSADVNTLRAMAGRTTTNETTTGHLTTLDLSGATFVADNGVIGIDPSGTSEGKNNVILNTGGSNINGSMFAFCDKLVTVTLPNNLSFVDQYAFYKCAALKTINIPTPATVTKIEGYAFEACLLLETIHINDMSALTKIGYRAFCDCHQLANFGANTTAGVLSVPNSVETIESWAFTNTSMTTLTLPVNASYNTITSQSFGWNEHLINATIPANVTTIVDQAFQSCTHMSNLAVNSTQITSIGGSAFRACKLLTDAQLNLLLAHITTVNSGTFAECTSLTNIVIPDQITTLKDESFAFCTGVKSITIGSGVTSIEKRAFAYGSKSDTQTLTEINVNPSVAPTCPAELSTTDASGNVEYLNPFNNIDANKVEVKFSADAASGYMSYRNQKAFMYLLTKTMDEDNNDYTVVPQRHADVVLHRTFKEGWNTLALPFGSAYDANKTTDCAEIFQKALQGKGTSGTSDFMIAAYRGLNATTNTFYFLKYANVTTDPLDEFEPLLIKMGAGDIASDNKYTFSNVEVNYDADGNTEYTASDVKTLIGKLAGTKSKYVDGNYNHDANAKFGACTYTDFYFTGTLYTRTNADNASDFIQTGDYIIQDNKFYKVADGKTYGLKGFRGWFKQLPTASPAKSSVVSIYVVGNEGETTDIVKIDANGEEVKDMSNAKVYNINGQFVGTSLNGLSKGLYIVNGKKYVVK
jgi:hypothetical protein